MVRGQCDVDFFVAVRAGAQAVVVAAPHEVVEVVPERGSAWTLVLKPLGHAGCACAGAVRLADRLEITIQRYRTPLFLRDCENLTFREEIEALKSRLNLRVVYVLGQPPPGWEGERGFVNADFLQRYLEKDRYRDEREIFLCGPQPMLDAVEAALEEVGVHVADFHTERFDLV